MKKLFLLFATVTLLTAFQSCKEKTEENATEEVVEDVTAEPAPLVGDSTTVAEDTSDRGVKTPTEPTK